MAAPGRRQDVEKSQGRMTSLLLPADGEDAEQSQQHKFEGRIIVHDEGDVPHPRQVAHSTANDVLFV